MAFLVRLCLLLASCYVVDSFAPVGSATTRHKLVLQADFLGGDSDDTEVEAIRAIQDFHQGSWQGSARSFTVTADVAAGIVQRKKIDYQVDVAMKRSKSSYALQETYSKIGGKQNDDDDDDKSTFTTHVFDKCNVDVDSVDASYSLDVTLTDFPAEIAGTDKLLQFMVEHCLVVSENERMRGFCFYGVDESLARLVICHEKRINADGGSPHLSRKSHHASSALTLHDASLLELSAGVWLGDAVMRDIPTVPVSPLERGQGFAPRKEKFAEWSIGVQKAAWRWMWNFGVEIRQVNDVGKSMGAELENALRSSLGGSVCVNEGLSRRIPKEERMVFIDWEMDNVGFLSGSTYLQAPRYLTFDRTRQLRPFFTDFRVFQREESQDNDGSEQDAGEEAKLPSIICSRMNRVYNYEGRLKQGVTSFFTFKRFGTEKDDLP